MLFSGAASSIQKSVSLILSTSLDDHSIIFRGLNPSEEEVQDISNELDMAGTGKVILSWWGLS